MNKLGADKLRKIDPSPHKVKKIKRKPIYFVLDEILDTFNVGSMFRLADAVAAEKIFLCGNMEFPPSIKIHRAAVGTQNWVPWEKKDNALEVVRQLKRKGVYTVAIEQDKSSVSYRDFKPKFPIAFILGHETKGVNKKILKEVDRIVELPLFGINKSFNVWGSAAVVVFKALEYLK